ncbi:MAG TPA: hypothetical protein VL172_19170, partial [Kofleriaceae bacterium]|nr:hypothetical protein [Kofleriaceae bacterium]
MAFPRVCKITSALSLCWLAACGSVAERDAGSATVVSVTSSTDDGGYGSGATIDIQVTFSEAVTVTGTPQITVNSGAPAVDYADGSGTETLTFTYTVADGEQADDLDVTELSANDGAITAAETDVDLTLPVAGGPSSLSGSKDLVVDAVAPAVTGVTSPNADGGYSVGALISVDVVFSEPVVVTGVPLLTLGNGAPPIPYTIGSGTSTLSFEYTVDAGQDTDDLDYADADALDLNGGTIEDAIGNTAVVSLPAPGADGSLSANKDLAVCTPGQTDACAGTSCKQLLDDGWSVGNGSYWIKPASTPIQVFCDMN